MNISLPLGKYTLELTDEKISFFEGNGEQHHFTAWKGDVLFEAITELLEVLMKQVSKEIAPIATKTKARRKKKNV